MIAPPDWEAPAKSMTAGIALRVKLLKIDLFRMIIQVTSGLCKQSFLYNFNSYFN